MYTKNKRKFLSLEDVEEIVEDIAEDKDDLEDQEEQTEVNSTDENVESDYSKSEELEEEAEENEDVSLSNDEVKSTESFFKSYKRYMNRLMDISIESDEDENNTQVYARKVVIFEENKNSIIEKTKAIVTKVANSISNFNKEIKAKVSELMTNSNGGEVKGAIWVTFNSEKECDENLKVVFENFMAKAKETNAIPRGISLPVAKLVTVTFTSNGGEDRVKVNVTATPMSLSEIDGDIANIVAVNISTLNSLLSSECANKAVRTAKLDSIIVDDNSPISESIKSSSSIAAYEAGYNPKITYDEKGLSFKVKYVIAGSEVLTEVAETVNETVSTANEIVEDATA